MMILAEVLVVAVGRAIILAVVSGRGGVFMMVATMTVLPLMMW